MTDDRRRHYRIEYPPLDRPKANVNGLEVVVLDVSESGLKYVSAGKGERPGVTIKGWIQFANDVRCDFQGRIIRRSDDHVILLLEKELPLKVIMAEQRRLIAKYGNLKRPDEPKDS